MGIWRILPKKKNNGSTTIPTPSADCFPIENIILIFWNSYSLGRIKKFMSLFKRW